MRTVFDFAAKRAELAPDAVAFEDAENGRQITFAAFNERAERGAAALEEMGVAEGGRVAILCHNSVTFLPKHVTVIDDYPRTAAGKVRKHVLRQMLT